jgi:hypothetical protein
MGNTMKNQLKVATRRELIEAVAKRYQASTRFEKRQILNELITVTGFHRKHALRALNGCGAGQRDPGLAAKPRARLYDEAVQRALIPVWEASDRLCGKRLKEAIPALVAAMERHGHLQLDGEVRGRLLAISAATLDRLLAPVRQAGTLRRRAGVGSLLRNAIAVRTFGDWKDPAPGYFEMDLVAHCGKSVAGSYAHSLVLTDIASGWTPVRLDDGARTNLGHPNPRATPGEVAGADARAGRRQRQRLHQRNAGDLLPATGARADPLPRLP